MGGATAFGSGDAALQQPQQQCSSCRRRRRPPLRWHSFAQLAACLAVVQLGVGGVLAANRTSTFSSSRRLLDFDDRGLGHDWSTVDGTRPKLEGSLQLRRIVMSLPTVLEPEAVPHSPSDNFTVEDPHKHPCGLVIDGSCQGFWAQTGGPVHKPYPQGAKECPNNCNSVGQCNYDVGECQCPAGFGGKDCSEVVKRPCSYRGRAPSDPDGVQIGAAPFNTGGWSASRCAGECDEAIGLCYCGYDSKHARVPAPEGSPWGTPPVKQGLTMVVPCQPRTGPNGDTINWGGSSWDELYGPNGWCNNPAAARNCPCALENQHGPECSIISEAWCPNQCNLRGKCLLGFCKCNEGWYGTACDKLKHGASYTEPAVDQASLMSSVWREPPHSKPPLPQAGVSGPASTSASAPAGSAQPPTPAHRKRPFIYVYDLPAEFNTQLVQMKNNPGVCNWRRFTSNNVTQLQHGVYQVETYMHEMMLQSTHRTLDPEEADFFYVPVYYASCYAWPILGWSDGPWWHVPTSANRPVQAAYMYLKAKRWLQQAYPYWNGSRGHDHIFLTAHDEGACYMPREIYDTAIFLTHWGRTDLHHESGTAYQQDNYSAPIKDGWELKDAFRDDWRDLWRGHPCYTPGKDLVIPSFKAPQHFSSSSLLGSQPLARDVLAYFKGDVGLHRLWWYSRGIRQTLLRLSTEDDWYSNHRIVIGDKSGIHDEYSASLARSKFCFVLPGDGWSGRAEDAVLHGCIPVIIQDRVEPPFHGVLDWDQFSVRIAEANMTHVPQILKSISNERLAEMQRALRRVWHRFVYATGPWHRKELRQWYTRHQRDARAYASYPLAPVQRFPFANDAFHTILQFLHSRIKTITRVSDQEAAAAEPQQLQSLERRDAPQQDGSTVSTLLSFFGRQQ